MTNFFYHDKFYDSVEELMIDLEIDETNIEDQPDFIKVTEAELQPIFKLNADWICERIDEERFTEDGDEIEKIEDALNKYIDFDKVNQMIPKLWYPTRNKLEITKADLYQALL